LSYQYGYCRSNAQSNRKHDFQNGKNVKIFSRNTNPSRFLKL